MNIDRIYGVRPRAALVLALSLCLYLAWAAPSTFCEAAYGAESYPSKGESPGWVTIQSEYFTIEYEDTVDIKSVVSRLSRRGILSGSFLWSDRSTSSAPEDKIAGMVDKLLKRAEETLNMYTPGLKLTLKIFNERSSLENAYFRMFGTRKDYDAFYVYENRTIYTSRYSVSDSVIIHEMAHAVVDDYFLVKPPPKVSELLATYVDAHCED